MGANLGGSDTTKATAYGLAIGAVVGTVKACLVGVAAGFLAVRRTLVLYPVAYTALKFTIAIGGTREVWKRTIGPGEF